MLLAKWRVSFLRVEGRGGSDATLDYLGKQHLDELSSLQRAVGRCCVLLPLS